MPRARISGIADVMDVNERSGPQAPAHSTATKQAVSTHRPLERPAKQLKTDVAAKPDMNRKEAEEHL